MDPTLTVAAVPEDGFVRVKEEGEGECTPMTLSALDADAKALIARSVLDAASRYGATSCDTACALRSTCRDLKAAVDACTCFLSVRELRELSHVSRGEVFQSGS